MCAIVDANASGPFFSQQHGYATLWNWILERGGRLVSGGRHHAEVTQPEIAKKWFLRLQRVGRWHLCSDHLAESAEAGLSEVALRSDDRALLAVARGTGARILCTKAGREGDAALEADFRNPAVLSGPRGRVFKPGRRTHAKLLHHDASCPPDARRVARAGRPTRGQRRRGARSRRSPA